MKTSSWFTKLPPGHVGIGISRGVPAGFEHLANYRKLAPGPWFKSCSSPARYLERYFGDILAKLDPRQVVADLQRLAGEAEPVMVCWEHPPPSPSWCHRALVSAWLFKTIGVAVPELGHEDAGFGWQHPKLHPTLKNSSSPVQAPFEPRAINPLNDRGPAATNSALKQAATRLQRTTRPFATIAPTTQASALLRGTTFLGPGLSVCASAPTFRPYSTSHHLQTPSRGGRRSSPKQ